MEQYFIDEHGIYTIQSCYHDNVESMYHVNFDEKDEEMKIRAFNAFVRHLRKEGADEKMREVKKQFKDLREFLA